MGNADIWVWFVFLCMLYDVPGGALFVFACSVVFLEPSFTTYLVSSSRSTPVVATKSVTHRMTAEVSRGGAALGEAYTAQPAYQTADNWWNRLKRNDLAA